MLYALHELQKTMAAPLVAWADANHTLFTNPYSPFAYHPLSRTHRGESRVARAPDALLRKARVGH